MAKKKTNKKCNKPARKQKPAVSPQEKEKAKAAKKKPGLSRRSMLLLLGAAPVALAGGYTIHQYDVNNKTLHDLSIIGEGKPVVVQVHDPSCPSCRRLKGATESALETMPDIVYRIADLTNNEGREIGQRYGVGKVTLLLFDAKGKHVHTIQGVTPKEELITQFERYLKTPAQS